MKPFCILSVAGIMHQPSKLFEIGLKSNVLLEGIVNKGHYFFKGNFF